MALSWILVAILLLVGAGPCLGWCLRYGRPRTIPACDCGYELSDLPQAMCPECGTPHMVTWARFQRRRRVRAFAAWTLVMAPTGLVCLVVSMLAAPVHVFAQQETLYMYGYTDRPGGALTLTVESQGWQGGPFKHRVWARYTRDSRSQRVEVPTPEDSFSVISALFDHVGTPYDDDVEGYKHEVADATARALTTGELPRRSAGVLRSSGVGSTSRSSERLAAEAFHPPWLAAPAWLAGVWLIVRRERRGSV